MGKMNDLGQVAPFHRGTELNLTGTVLFTQQTLDKRGFSGAVIAQNGDPLTALHIQVDLRKQCPFSKGFFYVFHLKHHITGKILLLEGGFHCLFRLRPLRLFDTLHPVLNGHCPAVKGAVIDAPALHTLHGVAQLLQFGLFLLILF